MLAKYPKGYIKKHGKKIEKINKCKALERGIKSMILKLGIFLVMVGLAKIVLSMILRRREVR